MRIKIIILYLSFQAILGFGQILPKYHKDVYGVNQSVQRNLLTTFVNYQKFNAVDSLIKQGYDINEPDVFGVTILGHQLLTLNDTAIIDSLLNRGACLDCGQFVSYYIIKEGLLQDFSIPLENAMVNRNKEVFIFLINKYKQLGYTKILSDKRLIETAITANNFVALLEFSNYFDFKTINERNILGNTILTQSARSIAQSYSLIKLLDKDNELDTFFLESQRIISFLLSKGADIDRANDKGETALEILKDIPQMAKFLQKKRSK